MRTHELKTWPDYFYRIFSGQKRFEVRKQDRDFQIGDILHLREYDPGTETYTGRSVRAEITYILSGGYFGIDPGYCVMSISEPTI